MVRAGRVLADMPAPAPAEHNFGIRALDELLEKPHRALRLGTPGGITTRHRPTAGQALVCLAELRDVLGDRALPRIIHDDASGGHRDVAFARAAVPRRRALVEDERRGVVLRWCVQHEKVLTTPKEIENSRRFSPEGPRHSLA